MTRSRIGEVYEFFDEDQSDSLARTAQRRGADGRELISIPDTHPPSGYQRKDGASTNLDLLEIGYTLSVFAREADQLETWLGSQDWDASNSFDEPIEKSLPIYGEWLEQIRAGCTEIKNALEKGDSAGATLYALKTAGAVARKRMFADRLEDLAEGKRRREEALATMRDYVEPAWKRYRRNLIIWRSDDLRREKPNAKQTELIETIFSEKLGRNPLSRSGIKHILRADNVWIAILTREARPLLRHRRRWPDDEIAQELEGIVDRLRASGRLTEQPPTPERLRAIIKCDGRFPWEVDGLDHSTRAKRAQDQEGPSDPRT